MCTFEIAYLHIISTRFVKVKGNFPEKIVKKFDKLILVRYNSLQKSLRALLVIHSHVTPRNFDKGRFMTYEKAEDL